MFSMYNMKDIELINEYLFIHNIYVIQIIKNTKDFNSIEDFEI